MGEVAAFAQVLTHVGLLKAIQNHVQFARARLGTYDTIDFVVVLFGYALSGERTLNAFYERLSPFADVFRHSLVAIVCPIVRPSLVFSPPLIRQRWRHCVHSFKRT